MIEREKRWSSKRREHIHRHDTVVTAPPTRATTTMGSQYWETVTMVMVATDAATITSTDAPATRLRLPSSIVWLIPRAFITFFTTRAIRAAKMKEIPHTVSASWTPIAPANDNPQVIAFNSR